MTVVAEWGGKRWTVDEVLGLAPDGSSAGAARRLSLSAVWSQAGSSGSLLWGRCQGGARQPYQVTIDLDEPSFRCSCPSRKHPCKHGLALLLLWAEGDGSVADDARPADFAAEWVQRLAAKAPAAARAERDTAPPDPEAQARRLAQRIETMSAGIDEFERWLFNRVGRGRVPGSRRQLQGSWRVGREAGRVAVGLDSAAAGASLAVSEVLGSVVEAEVVLYPGSDPRRALFTGERKVVATADRLPAGGVAAALDQVATWLAANPFADRFPVALAGVVPVVDGFRRMVVEPGGGALPLGGDGG